MHDKPRVSIITVCFNSAKTIRDTIESVINQTYHDIEYIIVDGGSSDGTVDIIKEYEPHIAKWVSEPDDGIYDAMNKGIRMATGEIIGIINSDDWLETDAIESAVGAFDKRSQTYMVSGQVRRITEDYRLAYIEIPVDDMYKKRFFRMPVPHPATFVKRTCYEEIGLFNIDYKIAADYEFVLRCMENGIYHEKIGTILTNMREGGISGKAIFSRAREYRLIHLQYGCHRIMADYIFVKSIVNSRLGEVLSKIPFYYRFYNAYYAWKWAKKTVHKEESAL